MPKVSVIIPCYNQGIYIDEAVDSILAQTYQDFEIIIVNDGSTDTITNEKISAYNHPKIKCITKKNEGLSEARNTGIRNSSGEYILPLDADDKIGNTYLEKAVKILDNEKKIGIVYCEAELFGDLTGNWNLPDFSKEEILLQNLIFCSAVFRRCDYDKTPGYQKNMIYGWEDWDFWLSMLEHDIQIRKINETLFFYRIKKESMITGVSGDDVKKKFLKDQVVKNHLEFYLGAGLNPIIVKEQLQSLSESFIQLKKSSGYYSTVYVDSGKGFNEQESESVEADISKNIFHLNIDLTGYQNISALRFDPYEYNAGKVRIKQIEIKKGIGESVFVEIDKLLHNGKDLDSGFVQFVSTDPMFYIPVMPEITGVIIDGEWEVFPRSYIEQIIIRTQDDLLRTQDDLVKTQDDLVRTQDDLVKTQDELQGIYHSDLWKCAVWFKKILKLLWLSRLIVRAFKIFRFIKMKLK